MLCCKGTEQYLQGGAQIPTGGKVRERAGVDPVKLRNRQYSLDGRRSKTSFAFIFHALGVYSGRILLYRGGQNERIMGTGIG